MATPYARPTRLTCTCVQTSLSNKAETYVCKDFEIQAATYKTYSFSALTDNEKVYMHKKYGTNPEFEEGATYILKNVNISNRNGQLHLLVGPATLKFRTTPLTLTPAAEKKAKEALCPPSTPLCGEEVDIYSRHGYITLQGQVKNLRNVRMTRADIPILNLKLQCGPTLLPISLWRDEALSDLHVGDNVQITHLHIDMLPRGRGHFHSSQYTTVTIEETPTIEKEIEILGITDKDNTCTLLTSDDEMYTVPTQFFSGDIETVINDLPMKVLVKHKNKRILSIRQLPSSFQSKP